MTTPRKPRRQTATVDQAAKRRRTGTRRMPLTPHACPATAAILLRIARPLT